MFSVIRPPEMIQAVEVAVSTRDPEPDKIQAAARIIFDQALWIPVQHHGNNYAYTENVHDLNFGAYSQWCASDLQLTWLSK